MKKIIFYIAFVLSVAIILCSCSTTHKIKATVKTNTDSTGTTTTDSSSIKKTATTELTQAQLTSTQANELNIEFETDDTNGFTADQLPDPGEKVNDYDGAAPKLPTANRPLPTAGYSYLIAGQQINSPQKIKSATFKNLVTNQTTALQIKSTVQTDSANLNKTQTTHKVQSQTASTKDKTTKSFPWLQLGLLAIILIVVAYLAWRFKLFAFLRRKKPKPLNS